DATNLDLTNTTLTGTAASPVVTVNALSTGTAVVPVSLINKSGVNGNQDACKNLTVHFKYSGTAQYTDVYATQTALTSSSNPSTTGQSVTYTATVSGVQGAGQDPVPSAPTGTVTFKEGTTALCSNVHVSTPGT